MSKDQGDRKLSSHRQKSAHFRKNTVKPAPVDQDISEEQSSVDPGKTLTDQRVNQHDMKDTQDQHRVKETESETKQNHGMNGSQKQPNVRVISAVIRQDNAPRPTRQDSATRPTRQDSAPVQQSAVTRQDSTPTPQSAVTRQDSTPTPTPAVTRHASAPTSQSAVTRQDSTPTPKSAVTRHDSTPTPQSAVTRQGSAPTPMYAGLETGVMLRKSFRRAMSASQAIHPRPPSRGASTARPPCGDIEPVNDRLGRRMVSSGSLSDQPLPPIRSSQRYTTRTHLNELNDYLYQTTGTASCISRMWEGVVPQDESLSDKVARLTKDRLYLKKDLEDAMDRLDQMTKQQGALQAQLASKQADKVQLEQRLLTLEKALVSNQQNLDTTDKELDSRTATSTPGSSTPSSAEPRPTSYSPMRSSFLSSATSRFSCMTNNTVIDGGEVHDNDTDNSDNQSQVKPNHNEQKETDKGQDKQSEDQKKSKQQDKDRPKSRACNIL